MSEVMTLGDIAQVVDCEHKTAPGVAPQLAYAYSIGTPALRGSDIDFSQAKPVSRETYVAWSRRAELRRGDVILAREAPIGGVGFVDGSKKVCLGQRTVLVRTNAELADPRFLFYLLQSPGPQTWMEMHSEGSTVKHLNVADVRRVALGLLPNLEEQRRIAGVLGALDDLIEVNRKLIADLIATADAIASRYLGRGDERSFGDVCDIFGGGTPSTKDQSFWNGATRWATPSDITALPSPYLFDTARRITQAGLDACSSKLMPVGSILMTSRATIGAFAVAQVPTAVNQGFIAVEPRTETDRWFLFHEMRRRVPEFIQRANGSTFLELSRGVFRGLTICWPSTTDREELHGNVAPIHAAAAALQVEIQDLAQTRDELLPLLMSGRVRVGDVAA